MSTTDTLARLPEIKARIEALPWPGPWTAHTFEVDCPCPNGEDCGDFHTCEQVEDLTAYPASPDEPAALGHGQCVVQIETPGLEMFAKPCAEFIANARVDMPDLVALVEELVANLDVAICGWCGHESKKTPEAMVEHQATCTKRTDALEMQLRETEAVTLRLRDVLAELYNATEAWMTSDDAEGRVDLALAAAAKLIAPEASK